MSEDFFSSCQDLFAKEELTAPYVPTRSVKTGLLSWNFCGVRMDFWQQWGFFLLPLITAFFLLILSNAGRFRGNRRLPSTGWRDKIRIQLPVCPVYIMLWPIYDKKKTCISDSNGATLLLCAAMFFPPHTRHTTGLVALLWRVKYTRQQHDNAHYFRHGTCHSSMHW